MNYYDISDEERELTGLDYDLWACLEYNPQTFLVTDVKRVLAVWEGEPESDDWRWILLLKDGRYVFLIGGCDFTGWDCQSDASSEFFDDPEKAALHSEVPDVCQNLHEQVLSGKNKTWREKKDQEFGL